MNKDCTNETVSDDHWKRKHSPKKTTRGEGMPRSAPSPQLLVMPRKEQCLLLHLVDFGLHLGSDILYIGACVDSSALFEDVGKATSFADILNGFAHFLHDRLHLVLLF